MLFDDRHGFTALQAVQSWSFAFMYDVGWSLRRAGVAAQAVFCAERGYDDIAHYKCLYS
jgi:hypothetical protein